MARSTFCTAQTNNTLAENLTRYFVIGGAYILETDENRAKIPFRTAGVFSGMYITAQWNNLGGPGATTVRLRKNTANANQSVSIPASTTGEFQDIANVDTCAAGDYFNFLITSGQGTTQSITLVDSMVNFEPDDRSLTLTKLVANQGLTSSLTDMRYMVITGFIASNATEANSQQDVNISGTFRNMYTYVSANTKAGTSNFRIRINGASGNCVVSVGAGLTGSFEDTANSDTITANDDLNFARDLTSSGAGSITWVIIAGELLTTDDTFAIHNGTTSGDAPGFGSTGYCAWGGGMGMWTEGWYSASARLKVTYSNLACRITANSINSGTCTWRLRKNFGNANQVLSIAAGATGQFEDTTNTDYFNGEGLAAAMDEGCYQVTTSGTSGTMTTTIIGMKGQLYRIKDAIGGGVMVPTPR